MAADKIVKHMSKTDDNWYVQNSIWVAKRDAYSIKENAKIKARQEGRKDAQIEVAKNALALSLPIEQISKISGLSEKEIIKIKNK